MRKTLPLIVAIACAGCAATGYEALKNGSGYYDLKLQTDTYEVGFKGNDLTDLDRVANFALLRAADVSVAEGYGFFEIVDSKSTQRRFYQQSPATVQSMTYTNNGGTSYSTSQFYPGAGSEFQRHGVILTIRCYKTKPASLAMVYDAKQVAENLRKHYDLAVPGAAPAAKK
jgi:hypothetical protein